MNVRLVYLGIFLAAVSAVPMRKRRNPSEAVKVDTKPPVPLSPAVEKPTRARKVRVKHTKKETTSPNPVHAKFEHFDNHDDDVAAETERSTGKEDGRDIKVDTTADIENAAKDTATDGEGETADELKQKMDMEIEGYHEMKRRIQFLEDHLQHHADFNLIKTEDLVTAQRSLQDIKDKIIKPLEVNLLSVRGQVSNLHHSVTKEERDFINSVIDNADKFLESSNKKMKNLEFIEQDWESMEESEKIRQISEGAAKPHQAAPGSQGASVGGPASLGSPLLRAMSQSLGNEGGLRSNRLRKIKKVLHAQKVAEHKAPRMEVAVAREQDIHVKEIRVDIHKLKEELDYERRMDEEPGYAHKVKEAMHAAAERSRKYLNEHLSHIRSEESQDSPPSWILVVVLGILSGLLMVTVVFLLCYRKRSRGHQTWRRNLCKGDNVPRGYCELSEVSQQTGIQNHWSESGWSSWDQRNQQKLK